MNEISYDYTRRRKDFGHGYNFTDTSSILASIDPVRREQVQWTSKQTSSIELDCIADVTERKVGTEAIESKNSGMAHDEGGFGKEVNNPKDVTERKRAIERYKGPNFNLSIVRMVEKVMKVVEQNNSIDLYEEYFTEEVADHSSEPPSLKTVCVLRDPNPVKRSATNLCWCPDGTTKLAVSYSVLQFQKMADDLITSSYIWDISNPNEPDLVLSSPSPAVCLAYNPKSTDWIVGGLYNGLVAFWDLRKGNSVETSPVEYSHHDPIYDVVWTQSRTNQEFCSVSTDGFVKWWDVRKLSAPVDSFACSMADENRRYGGISLEYRIDAGPNKFLVGTETGEVLSLERKSKKDSSSSIGIKQVFGGECIHHGPVYSVKRNPHFSKYFLSVGDWTSKIWSEDLKQPVLLNRFEQSYLTACCWSPSRSGVFFTAKMNGTIDVWDLFYKLNEPVLCNKVGDSALSSIALHGKGKLLAVGSEDGQVSILELCESLSHTQNNEKNAMQQLFERETKREKHVDQLRSKKSNQSHLRKSDSSSERENPSIVDDAALRQAEEDFYNALGNVVTSDGHSTENSAAEN